jgi:hypothetical protein
VSRAEKHELTDEELERQRPEELPDREVMSVIKPGVTPDEDIEMPIDLTPAERQPVV